MRRVATFMCIASLISGCSQTSLGAAKSTDEKKLAPQTQSFPEINNWQSLRNVYSCGGPPWVSPNFSVEISGAGAVTYVGGANVATLGERQGRIDQASLRKLVQQFRAGKFFRLKEAYRDRITDQDRVYLTISFDGLSKIVEDCAGRESGCRPL